MPQERITALKTDETSVEMTDVTERANDIIQSTEAPPQLYPFITTIDISVCYSHAKLPLTQILRDTLKSYL